MGLQVTGVPTQPPLLQTSPVVQALLSVQLIPFLVESAWQIHLAVSPSTKQTGVLQGRQSGTFVLEHVSANAVAGKIRLETMIAAAALTQNPARRSRPSAAPWTRMLPSRSDEQARVMHVPSRVRQAARISARWAGNRAWRQLSPMSSACEAARNVMRRRGAHCARPKLHNLSLAIVAQSTHQFPRGCNRRRR